MTETSTTLRGEIDTGTKKVSYRFEYIPLAAYLADEEAFGPGAEKIPVPDGSLPAHPEAKGGTQAGSPVISALEVTNGFLGVGQVLTGSGIPGGATIVSLDLAHEQLTLSKAATVTSSGLVKLTATGPQPLSAELVGLSPGTAYRARLVAKNNSNEEADGPTLSLVTLSSPQDFAPCANDELRFGGPHVLLPATNPSAALPDCRAYEQATPIDKDGGEAEGEGGLIAAAPRGDAITFLSNFGFPGGVGAQTVPLYLGTRGPAGWSSAGLLPSERFGEGAQVLGWAPDFSASYSRVTRYTEPPRVALLAQPRGQSPRLITPYVAEASFSYVGASADGRFVFFESRRALPPEEGAPPIPGAVDGAPNLYVWDRETARLSLAGAMNDAAAPPKGVHAGPYDWAGGSGPLQLGQGGAERQYYLQDTNAVSETGAVFFTAAGTGQLYERINPIASQSAVIHVGEPDEECTEAAKACTIHISATHKTNGVGTTSDPAGPQPAAFQAASADGTTAYFTSSEKLTNDANTGPEQPPAQIGGAKPGEEEAEEVNESLLPTHALGLATSSDGSHLYWADPSLDTIGRAGLDASGEVIPGSIEPAFVEPGPTECEAGLHEASKPRYVAAFGEYVYWTNTGCPEVPGKKSTEGRGSIGRARLEASGDLIPESVEPEFIPGRVETSPGVFVKQVTQPQGIAVNAGHIYWANDGFVLTNMARAKIEGEEVEPEFFKIPVGREPFGVTLDATYIYFASDSEPNNTGLVSRLPLAGGPRSESQVNAEIEELAMDKGGVRGVAVDGSHVYWASQHEESIGRVGLDEFERGECETTASLGHVILGCKRHYIPLQGLPEGLATGPEAHIYFSVNGEAPSNPGTDLYRFHTPGSDGCQEVRGCLTDLTPDATGDGAEVQGVLAASRDGSYVYFVAGGVLAANEGAAGTHAASGECQTSTPHGIPATVNGRCNLYLYHEGTTVFIAPLRSDGHENQSDDWLDWTPTLTPGSQPSPRTSRLSTGGRALLFRSVEQLTPYPNQGTAEFYLYRAGQPDPISCLSCNPTGQVPTAVPQLGDVQFPWGLGPPLLGVGALLTRNLSADGQRFFFETPEALVGADTDASGGCPITARGKYLSCLDVYEWEAPGAGSCTEASSAYSAADRGCLYLISTGKGPGPSLFADASESGEDVFFFTIDQLVGQDQDSLRDVYDARTEGGLASQSPLPEMVCESKEACASEATPPPNSPPGPATPSFQGEGNVRQKACPKGRVRHHGRCLKRHAKKRKSHRRHRRAHR